MTTTKESSTSNQLEGVTPFKVQVNFDIPLFEVQIDVYDLEKWLNLLEGYYSVQNFYDNEKITFMLIKSLPQVKSWWEGYWERYTIDEYTPFGRESTWEDYVYSIKEEFYPIRNYDDQYMRWITLRKKKGQTLSEYNNIFHTLCSNMGIKDSDKHLVFKYHSGMHRYIQTKMDLLGISSLGVSYQYAVKNEQKFKQ
jgi:hypothetical protein